MNNVFVCIGYTKINWQNLLPFYESAWRKVKKADQDTVMSICTQQSKKKKHVIQRKFKLMKDMKQAIDQ